MDTLAFSLLLCFSPCSFPSSLPSPPLKRYSDKAFPPPQLSSIGLGAFVGVVRGQRLQAGAHITKETMVELFTPDRFVLIAIYQVDFTQRKTQGLIRLDLLAEGSVLSKS